MSNECRILYATHKSELKDAAVQERRQLVKGALEVSRNPLHDLSNDLLDYFLDWVIAKLNGSAN